MIIMTRGEHSQWPHMIYRCKDVAPVGMAILSNIKVLVVVFVLWTDLHTHGAGAAASTFRQTRMSDESDGMLQPEIIFEYVDDQSVELNRQKSHNMDVDEEVGQENGRQAFELQRADREFHRQQEVAQSSNVQRSFDSSQLAPSEVSGGRHVLRDYQDIHKKNMLQYTINSVTNPKLMAAMDDGAIIPEILDEPVAQHIKSSSAKLSSSKHINKQLVDVRSSVEADFDRVVLQESDELALDASSINNAGHTKKKPGPQLQLAKLGRPEYIADSGAPDPDLSSKSDIQYESAKKKQDYESRKQLYSSTVTPIIAGARKDEEEVQDVAVMSMTEEREEDKKLIPDYNLGEPIKDWNQKRQEWAREHPEVKQERLFILTGTQPWPCNNAEGDHLLLRCFKNKVDYSRIHGVGLFYNTALLDAHMPGFWAKLPVVRATMLAHPEVEWIWWLDADAIITDMEFSIPLHRYSAYNLVVHGWESLIFEKRSWLGLNAGSFLLRNCQWSLELLERWASMGPKAPMGDAYRHILSDFLPDRERNPTDDQAALVFLLIKERQRWAGKLRVELDFFLSGYWLELMDGFEATEERYLAMEDQHAELWELLERQGAVGKEKLVAAVGRAREQRLSASGTTVQQRRPFITHFTGCQPCSGHHNNIYSWEQCHSGLLRALNYADDQVLRTLGYHHRSLLLPDVLPSPTSSTKL